MRERGNVGRAEPSPPSSLLTLLDRVLFTVLVAVFSARPLISETFAASLPGFIEAITSAAGPTPLATITLDALLLVASVVVFVRYPPRRLSLLTIGFALLASGVVVSTAFASDRRGAANAGADLLIVVAAGGALARLMRQRAGESARPTAMVHLLLAGVIAAGCTNAVKCYTQRAVEFDDTLETWVEQKQQLAAAGVDVHTPMIQDYERRLRSADVFGYLSHPNVTAACMTTALLVVFAALLIELRAGLHVSTAAAVLLIVMLAPALPLTGSLGGVATAALGAALLVGFALARRLIRGHARLAFGLLLGAYVLGIAGGAAYGLARGTLPHPSLAFRWEYWTATAGIIADHPIAGVGRENFGAHYLQHKSASATEDVSNPHNIWLSLLAELGPLGLLGGAILAFGVLARAVSAIGPGETASPQGGGRGFPDQRGALNGFWVIVCAAAAIIVQALASGTPLSGPNVAILWGVETAGVFALSFVAAAWLLDALRHYGAHRDYLAAGCAIALLAALVHNLIGFSLITPAGLSVFTTIAACGMALEGAKAPRREGARGACDVAPFRRVASGALGAIATLFYFVLIVRPSAQSLAEVRRMDATLAGARSPAAVRVGLEAGRRAVRADPWNAFPARRLIRNLYSVAANPNLPPEASLDYLDEALRVSAKARQRDAASVSNWRLAAAVQEARAAMLRRLGRAEQADHALRSAADDRLEVVGRNPANPRDRISAAEVLAELWRRTGAKRDALTALGQIRAARRIDAARPPGVTARLQEEELRRLDQLEQELTRSEPDSD